MLAWSEGTDNGRQKTRNHGYDVIVGGELFTDYSDHPRKLVTLNPKLKSTGAGRYQLFPVAGCLPRLAWKTSLRKVRTLWHCSRLRSVALYLGIDRGDIRQAIDRCSNIWASLPGAGYGQFEHKADSLDCKIQRSGRNGQRDWCMSRVTAIIPALVICIIVCLSWAVNGQCVTRHYLQSPARQKCQRTGSWRTRQLLTCRCQRDVAALDAKYTKELADAKAENDALRDDAGWSSSVAKQSVSQCVKPPPPPAWIMQPPPDWQTPLNGDYFCTLRERLITMQKQLEGTQKYINEQCRWVAHIDGQPSNYCEQYTRASSGV